MSAYCTVEQIEAATSLRASDFKQAGVVMTPEQWTAYLTDQIQAASKQINNVCRRSFEVTEYVDIRDGKWQNEGNEYALLEQPVVSVTKVEEDITPHLMASWTVRTPRSDLVAGDYSVQTRNWITSIVFSRTPLPGRGNIRITYTAGYTADSDAMAEISTICQHIVENVLTRKSRLQESRAARTQSSQDVSATVPVQDPTVFTSQIRTQLKPYIRYSMRRP
jgi:hypothetical protein